jgi:hypothetical protein
MRHSNFRNTALISFLTAAVAACSSGSDSPTKPTTTATTGGSGGAGSTTSGGTAGSTSGTTSSTTTNPTTSSTVGAGGSTSTTTGTGGSGGSGGSGGPSVCDGKGTRLLAAGDGVIDNFEAAMISPGWSSFNDVQPTPNSFKIAQEAGGALGTGHFGHYAGTGAKPPLMGGYGVGTIYNEAIDVGAGIYCVDISGFDGVTFWAKAATAGAKVGVNFVLPETNAVATDPTLGGGDCVSSCYNHPYKTITLTASWAQYSVTFAEAGMGSAKVGTRLQMLGWLSPDVNWDFSLDEIQLYKGTPPTGPIAKADGGP